VASLAARLCPAVLRVACDLAGSGVASSAAAFVDGEPPVKLKDVSEYNASVPPLALSVCVGVCERWGAELCVCGGPWVGACCLILGEYVKGS
jgi:hypothetical protein